MTREELDSHRYKVDRATEIIALLDKANKAKGNQYTGYLSWRESSMGAEYFEPAELGSIVSFGLEKYQHDLEMELKEL